MRFAPCQGASGEGYSLIAAQMCLQMEKAEEEPPWAMGTELEELSRKRRRQMPVLQVCTVCSTSRSLGGSKLARENCTSPKKNLTSRACCLPGLRPLDVVIPHGVTCHASCTSWLACGVLNQRRISPHIHTCTSLICSDRIRHRHR